MIGAFLFEDDWADFADDFDWFARACAMNFSRWVCGFALADFEPLELLRSIFAEAADLRVEPLDSLLRWAF
ncbi:MAG: hypothetical protein FWD65_08210 [Coriobacteriia bacterium]|nr:hypothetical protein [Coriobacteriia bacterium]